jgi:hypothetical protein
VCDPESELLVSGEFNGFNCLLSRAHVVFSASPRVLINPAPAHAVAACPCSAHVLAWSIEASWLVVVEGWRAGRYYHRMPERFLARDPITALF